MLPIIYYSVQFLPDSAQAHPGQGKFLEYGGLSVFFRKKSARKSIVNDVDKNNLVFLLFYEPIEKILMASNGQPHK